MKFLSFFHLALQYLLRYRRRYFFLFIALAFGFGIVTFMTSLKDGMSESLYVTAQSHYAGDIVVLGLDSSFANSYHLRQEDVDAVLAAAETTGMNPAHIAKRTQQFGNDSFLYCNGTAVQLKYVIGVDWESETDYFNKLNYAVPPDVSLVGDSALLLSSPIAKALGARQGDSLILEIENRTGQKNTGVFVIAGIVDDSSLFGYYKAYISRSVLNALIGYEDADCSMVGFFLNNRSLVEPKRSALHQELSSRIQTAPLVYNRNEYSLEGDNPWDGVKVFVLTLAVYLSEVAQLLEAINLLVYFLFIMMLLIIFASAVVTCQLILHERTREIGTMRAIGFYQADIRHIMVMETLCLGIISLALGFIFAHILSFLLTFVPTTWFPSFEIFMKDGKLITLYRPQTILLNIAAVLCMLFPAIWFPAVRASRAPLPQMLTGVAI
jgi:ABC-type lipoprotein release transport system permease subunit